MKLSSNSKSETLAHKIGMVVVILIISAALLMVAAIALGIIWRGVLWAWDL